MVVLAKALYHPEDLESEEVKKISILFLFPKIINLLQPMDQILMESFKRRYRHKLFLEILCKLETENIGFLAARKSINNVNFIYMAIKAY